MCKGTEVGTCLTWRNSREASVVRVETGERSLEREQ